MIKRILKLKVGAGRGIITPPVGAMMMGYAPARASEAVNDELNVTAVACEYGETKAMLLSADVCIIKSPRSEYFRKCISEATGIAFENIILSATHTHSGPVMRETPEGIPVNEKYISNIFEPGLVKAAKDAVKNLKEAQTGIGTIESDIGINRRAVDRFGKVHIGQNPWGSRDSTMTVISFKGLDGKPIANLVHYGAHGTAAGKNTEITRDWPGPMVDCLEEYSGAMTMFLNGAEGDCGPRLPNGKSTGNLDMMIKLGDKAAKNAVQAFRNITNYSDADLKIACDDIRLPYEPFPTTAEIEKNISELGDPDKLRGLNIMKHARLLDRLAESKSNQARQTHMILKQTIVALGPIAFVPFPFEIFSEITLRLREHSPYKYTLSLSNSNGANFYFPSQEQIRRGGYEVEISKSMNTYSLADNADDAVVDENLRVLNKLFSQT